jgi:hypothetical protein
MIKITKKTTNNIFAIFALSLAIPPNPKTAAINARIRKMKAQFNNMSAPFYLNTIPSKDI